MGKNNRYTVDIGNNSYVIRTNKDKEETESLVNYVNEEILRAKESISKGNPTMEATLAALNIADEYSSIKEEYLKLKQICELPLENYEPLKDRFTLLEEEKLSLEERLKDLESQVIDYKKELRLTELDRDNFKLELDRHISSSKKQKEDIELLRKNLLSQEKETLKAKKQLQELIRNMDKNDK